MLTITIPSAEFWDEKSEQFIYTKAQTLKLEHSLVSISKWESRWHKPFLSKETKTYEETIDYIKCMTLTQNVSPDVYQYITNANIDAVNQYIAASLTASTVREEKGGSTNIRKNITSELIYYWMVCYNIPLECQKWHLSRLFMLIRICEAENKPHKKRSKRDLYRYHNEVNAANRKRFNSKG